MENNKKVQQDPSSNSPQREVQDAASDTPKAKENKNQFSNSEKEKNENPNSKHHEEIQTPGLSRSNVNVPAYNFSETFKPTRSVWNKEKYDKQAEILNKHFARPYLVPMELLQPAMRAIANAQKLTAAGENSQKKYKVPTELLPNTTEKLEESSYVMVSSSDLVDSTAAGVTENSNQNKISAATGAIKKSSPSNMAASSTGPTRKFTKANNPTSEPGTSRQVDSDQENYYYDPFFDKFTDAYFEDKHRRLRDLVKIEPNPELKKVFTEISNLPTTSDTIGTAEEDEYVMVSLSNSEEAPTTPTKKI